MSCVLKYTKDIRKGVSSFLCTLLYIVCHAPRSKDGLGHQLDNGSSQDLQLSGTTCSVSGTQSFSARSTRPPCSHSNRKHSSGSIQTFSGGIRSCYKICEVALILGWSLSPIDSSSTYDPSELCLQTVQMIWNIFKQAEVALFILAETSHCSMFYSKS